MSRVGVESKVWTDWRFIALAKRVGVDIDSLVGKMIRIWDFCTEHQTYFASELALATITGIDKFAHEMCECELGERMDDGTIRVRGTRGRIEWLGERRHAASKGGKSSGKSRRSQLEANAKQTPSKRQANAKQKGSFGSSKTNPLTLATALATATALAPDPEETGAAAAPPAVQEPLVLAMGSSAPVASSGQRQVTQGFFELFQAHNEGAKPTWNKKQAGQVQDLLRSHSPGEILRRAKNMFAGPPMFPRGHCPTLDTLVSHFDAFAVKLEPRAGPARAQAVSDEDIFTGRWREHKGGDA